MLHEAISEARIGGAILGRLFPPFDLAADELYERVSAGERIGGTHLPSELGFQTGVVDHVLVEAFLACVPAVKSFLTGGGMALMATWIGRKHDATELQRRIAELENARKELQGFRELFERLIAVLQRQGVDADRESAEARLVRSITEAPEHTAANRDDRADL